MDFHDITVLLLYRIRRGCKKQELLQRDHQLKPAVLGAERVKSVMPFAESHNGARADSVVGFLRLGKPVLSKGNLPMVRIFDLKHELRHMDAPDDDFSLLFRKPLTGVYGIFQGVGKADAKLGGVDGQRFRKGKPSLHCNAGTLRTAEIGRERGV